METGIFDSSRQRVGIPSQALLVPKGVGRIHHAPSYPVSYIDLLLKRYIPRNVERKKQ